jgi:hypothetical protein
MVLPEKEIRGAGARKYSFPKFSQPRQAMIDDVHPTFGDPNAFH